MLSPTCRTEPTSATFTCLSNPSICRRMIELTSSALICILSPMAPRPLFHPPTLGRPRPTLFPRPRRDGRFSRILDLFAQCHPHALELSADGPVVNRAADPNL